MWGNFAKNTCYLYQDNDMLIDIIGIFIFSNFCVGLQSSLQIFSEILRRFSVIRKLIFSISNIYITITIITTLIRILDNTRYSFLS